jgi:hypothetical protein
MNVKGRRKDELLDASMIADILNQDSLRFLSALKLRGLVSHNITTHK